MLPEDAPAALAEALRAVARRTEQVRADDIVVIPRAEVVFAGRIAEVTEGYVLLVRAKGPGDHGAPVDGWRGTAGPDRSAPRACVRQA